MSETSSNLQLPYLAQGQAQKHVTINEAIARLDALTQLVALSATTAAEPGAPGDGAVYILPSGKTGDAWAAMANGALAYFHDGAWEEITPRTGWLAIAADDGALLCFDGAAWTRLSAAQALSASASDKVFGRMTPSAGAAEEIAFTAAARALCDDASFAAMCATLGTWRVIAASAVAVAHTGDTLETTLATITVPAGAMGPNGALRVTSLWSITSSANTKTLRYRLGGSAMLQSALTTSSASQQHRLIQNRNAQNAQVAHASSFSNSFGQASGASVTTSAIDTSAPASLTLTGQLANSAETITLESYVVELFHGA